MQQNQILINNNWKELYKNLVDKCNNISDYQKEMLKFILEIYYNNKNNSIIKNEIQAKQIESMIRNN